MKRHTGLGVRTRHSRRCRREPCTCEPSFEAYVWITATGKKRRRTFSDRTAARRWRTEELRRLYAEKALTNGRADNAYGFLRKAAQQLDSAIPSLPKHAKPGARAALGALYEAEDRLLTVLTQAGDT